LIDTTASYNNPAAWEDRAAKALTEGLASLTDFQVTRWFTDAFRSANPDIVAASVKTFVANDPKAYSETCRMLGTADLLAALPRMTMPAAIVVGDEDYATPVAMAQTMKTGLPNATIKVLDNARHLTPLETPERVAIELMRLLQPVAVT
jgi:3-oxoadipate enol-lactonase